MAAFKNRIRELREERGWGQHELAERCSTTNQQISRLEAGQRELTQRWMERLGSALGVNPVHILPPEMTGQPFESEEETGFEWVDMERLYEMRWGAPVRQESPIQMTPVEAASISALAAQAQAEAARDAAIAARDEAIAVRDSALLALEAIRAEAVAKAREAAKETVQRELTPSPSAVKPPLGLFEKLKAFDRRTDTLASLGGKAFNVYLFVYFVLWMMFR